MDTDPATNERRSNWREGHAVGAIVGVLLLGLIIVGVIATLLFAPLFKATTPTQVPGQEQSDGAE
jgi:uncharacterized iron-regulated membrane protein